MVVQKRHQNYVPQVEPTEADAKARAERLAKVAEKQKADAPKAMAEYRATEAALRKKNDRLRAERLAREAALKKK